MTFKRKIFEGFSINFFIVRNRKRLINVSKFEKLLLKIKHKNFVNTRYHVKQLKKNKN